jgi:hypothetical protein
MLPNIRLQRPVLRTAGEPARQTTSMSAGPSRPKWRWREGPVDRRRAHFELRHGSVEKSGWDGWLPVASVGRATRGTFPVRFLIDRTAHARSRVIRDVARELDFYLVAKGDSDPWAYARYHCGTSANVYSTIHWTFFPGPTRPALPAARR